MAVSDRIEAEYSRYFIGRSCDFGEETLLVRKDGILPLCRFLDSDPTLTYNLLLDLTVVDYWGQGKPHRFEVVYHVYSLANKHRLRIKVPLAESDCSLDSVVSVWVAANWMEREAFDMYGIHFAGHPDLRRILLYPGFVGHPLRKDYPLKKRQPLVGPNTIRS